MDTPKGFQFAIDRGGTFTDVFARCPNGKVRVMKLLSVDPQNYDDAPREAIRRILQEVSSQENRELEIFMVKWQLPNFFNKLILVTLNYVL